MSKRKRGETKIQEECDKWLTTIGKQKISGNKQRRFKAIPFKPMGQKPLLELQFTQTKFPVTATKQSKIEAFFKTKTGEVTTVSSGHDVVPQHNSTTGYVDVNSTEYSRKVQSSGGFIAELEKEKENDPCHQPCKEYIGHTGTCSFDECKMYDSEPKTELPSLNKTLGESKGSPGLHSMMFNYCNTEPHSVASKEFLVQTELYSVLFDECADGVTKVDAGSDIDNMSCMPQDDKVDPLGTRLEIDPCLSLTHSEESKELSSERSGRNSLLSCSSESQTDEMPESLLCNSDDYPEFTFHSEKWSDDERYDRYRNMGDYRNVTQELKNSTQRRDTPQLVDTNDEYSEFTFHSEKWKDAKKYDKYRQCSVVVHSGNECNISSQSQNMVEQSEFTFHSQKWEDKDSYKRYRDLK